MRILKLESSEEFLSLLQSLKGLNYAASAIYVMKKQVENHHVYQAIGPELLFTCSTATPGEFDSRIRESGFRLLKGEGFIQ